MTLFIVTLQFISLIIVYYILKYKNTKYEYKTIMVLKDNVKINHLKGIDRFNNEDEVNILETTKLVWGRVVSKKLSIEINNYDDDDDHDY